MVILGCFHKRDMANLTGTATVDDVLHLACPTVSTKETWPTLQVLPQLMMWCTWPVPTGPQWTTFFPILSRSSFTLPNAWSGAPTMKVNAASRAAFTPVNIKYPHLPTIKFKKLEHTHTHTFLNRILTQIQKMPFVLFDSNQFIWLSLQCKKGKEKKNDTKTQSPPHPHRPSEL